MKSPYSLFVLFLELSTFSLVALVFLSEKMNEVCMTNDELENNDNNPDLTFDYKGNLFIVLAWLIWSIVGFVYLVVISKTESPFMEVFYVLSAILSVNALNNRKYGVNHSIRFYSDLCHSS